MRLFILSIGSGDWKAPRSAGHGPSALAVWTLPDVVKKADGLLNDYGVGERFSHFRIALYHPAELRIALNHEIDHLGVLHHLYHDLPEVRVSHKDGDPLSLLLHQLRVRIHP